MSKKIVVLGSGLVGSAMARDLNEKYDVLAVDINPGNLEKLTPYNIGTQVVDLSNPEAILKLAESTDLFIGAVPGAMGFNTVKTVIESNTPIVDISFFPEDALLLDDLAKKHGVTAIVDCGVAPGMGNVILGYENSRMKVTDYFCAVGGLPDKKEWPYAYKAVFSPRDVIEEYTRPARYVVNGALVTREALSDIELDEYPEVGTLESWNSDGLRSLIKTMPHIPNMIEKTLRYPGTTEYLKVLRRTGYFSEEEIEVKGQRIKPIDLTAKLLFPMWELQKGETEFTVMKIRVTGEQGGKTRVAEYDLLDRFDKEKQITSMARTTGYTATAAAELILEGGYDRKGIIPPEYLGETESDFEFMVNYLENRNVIYHYKESFK